MLVARGKIQPSPAVNFSWRARALLGFLLLPFPAVAASIPTKPYASLISLREVFRESGLPPQVKSKIEQELDQKGNSKNTPGARKKTTNTGHSSSLRRTSTVEYPVVFISDVPGAEIALDGTVIGRTKEDRRLALKVKKGQYKATVSLKGYNSQTIPVSVFGDATYTLTLGKPIPAPVPTPTPVAVVAPTPEATPPSQPPPPATDDIVKRFINPYETGKLTAADWRAVIAENEEVTKLDPTSNVQATARYHLGQGQLAYLEKNYAESISEFNRGVLALPRSGIAYYALGNAYLATNQPLEATKAYQNAIQLTPEVAGLAFKGMGDALTKLHKPRDANSYYLKARGLGCLSPDINKGIALNLMAEKQWQKALSELEAIEAGDSSAERYLYLGECYVNLKRPLNAYQAYLKVTQLDPSSAFAFWKLGDVLFVQRDFPAAKDAYERALAIDTTGNKIDREIVRKRANAAAAHTKK